MTTSPSSYAEAADRWGVPVCFGCDWYSVYAHQRGRVADVVHWREASPTRRGWLRFAYLCAKWLLQERRGDRWRHDLDVLELAQELYGQVVPGRRKRDPWQDYFLASCAKLSTQVVERMAPESILPPSCYDVTMPAKLTQQRTKVILKLLCDAAVIDKSGRARERLRKFLADYDTWRTKHVLWNIGERRCRFLSSLGYDIPPEYLWREYEQSRLKRLEGE